MRDVTLEKDELLVSFNVSSFFAYMYVPIGEAVQAIQTKLEKDDGTSVEGHMLHPWER